MEQKRLIAALATLSLRGQTSIAGDRFGSEHPDKGRETFTGTVGE